MISYNSSKCKYTVYVLLVSVLFLLLPNIVFAQADVPFSVSPVFSESQSEDITNYFDLIMEPGEIESFGVALRNETTEPVEVEITAHTAYTNVNGVVEYGRNPEEVNPTLLYALGDLLTTPDILVIPAGETIVAPIEITMPKESFEGVLAGGLRIQEANKEGTSGDGLVIENEFSFIMGVVVSVSNNRRTVTPELELLDVFANQLNYRNVFSATLQNYTPTFINQLEVDAKIRAVGEQEVLYEAQKSGMQMAPNSHFDFPIALEGKRFQAGDYILSMEARSGEHEWIWEYEFTVEADEARQWNRQDVDIDSAISIWIIILIGLLLLLVGIVVYLLLKQRKKDCAM